MYDIYVYVYTEICLSVTKTFTKFIKLLCHRRYTRKE